MNDRHQQKDTLCAATFNGRVCGKRESDIVHERYNETCPPGKHCEIDACHAFVPADSTKATEGAVCPPHPVDEYGTCTGCGQKIDIAQQLIDAAQQDGLSEFLRATIKSAWCEIKDLRTAVSQIAAIAKEAANA